MTGDALLQVSLDNEGYERGQPFRDQVSARVAALRLDGVWHIAAISVDVPEESEPPIPKK